LPEEQNSTWGGHPVQYFILLMVLFLILLNYLNYSFCNEKKLYLEYIEPYEISFRELQIGDFSFSDRYYKIRKVPIELLGLSRLYFPGGVKDYYKIMTDRLVRIYAVFNYNPNWCFPKESSPEDYGWFLYKRKGYKGDSNIGEADIYFKDFSQGVIELEVPKWWLCLGITELNPEFIDKKNINIPVRYISHAGYILPEPNTLESVQKAMELGAYGVEIDVQLTKDNIPILLHDFNLFREVGVNLNCEDLTLYEIQKYKRRGIYRIPTLEEVINFTAQKKLQLLLIDATHIPVDRSRVAIYEIEKIISKYNAYDWVIIQVNKDELIDLINLEAFKVSWNTYNKLKDNSRIKFYTLNPIFWSQRYMAKNVVSFAHKNGAKVVVVCLYPETYLINLQSGCDYIMVFDIEKFKKFCRIYQIPLWDNK